MEVLRQVAEYLSGEPVAETKKKKQLGLIFILKSTDNHT